MTCRIVKVRITEGLWPSCQNDFLIASFHEHTASIIIVLLQTLVTCHYYHCMQTINKSAAGKDGIIYGEWQSFNVISLPILPDDLSH